MAKAIPAKDACPATLPTNFLTVRPKAVLPPRPVRRPQRPAALPLDQRARPPARPRHALLLPPTRAIQPPVLLRQPAHAAPLLALPPPPAHAHPRRVLLLLMHAVPMPVLLQQQVHARPRRGQPPPPARAPLLPVVVPRAPVSLALQQKVPLSPPVPLSKECNAPKKWPCATAR